MVSGVKDWDVPEGTVGPIILQLRECNIDAQRSNVDPHVLVGVP